MKTQASIELFDLELITEIGTYGPGDIKPDAHLLNLILEIDAKQVLILNDEMKYVFDYDPLIKEIDRLAGICKYETQEYLMTRIASACAAYSEIKKIEISLRKAPVRNGNGSLGIRLILDETATNELRSHKKTDQAITT
ncbi:MAG: dihydroneopterin aldolase [Bdellovibrionales bacterium]|nr:dihydroneopterin aldolase [Massilia sp.]